MKKFHVLLTCLMVMLLAGLATAAPTLPDTGIDVAAYVPVVVTTLGTVLAAVIGGIFAFWIVKKAINMIRRIGA